MGLIDQGPAFLFSAILRFLQFVFAITVCGLYGVDLENARKQGKYVDGRWAFAEVVGALSAFTAVLYMIPFVMRKLSFLFVWDAILFLFWIVLFGIFGKLFINENPEGNSDIQRMKNAVWIDLVNMLLWLCSTVFMVGIWWKDRRQGSQFTGRAHI